MVRLICCSYESLLHLLQYVHCNKSTHHNETNLRWTVSHLPRPSFELECSNELGRRLNIVVVVSQAQQTVSNTIIKVGVELIPCLVQPREIGYEVVLSIFLTEGSHANLKVLWSNIVAESCKPINSCCRHAVGSWDLGAECVKWGLCLFMCDRVSHLLLPFNRIRRRTGRCLLVWSSPRGANSRSPKIYGHSKAGGLKYNLELCTANHTGSPGNNTPRYCMEGRWRRGDAHKIKWMVWAVMDTCKVSTISGWIQNINCVILALKWEEGSYTHGSSGIINQSNSFLQMNYFWKQLLPTTNLQKYLQFHPSMIQ